MRLYILFILAAVVALVPAQAAQAATLNIPCDTNALINAMNTANANPGADTINLAANCTYTLSRVYDSAGGKGANGLPAVENNGALTINGNGATIQRGSSGQFRLMFVRRAAVLTLNNVTLANGQTPRNGGALFNDVGTVILNNSVVTGNQAFHGGGIANEMGGRVSLYNSTLTMNAAAVEGGALYNDESNLDVFESVVALNRAYYGGAIYNDGNLVIEQSSIFENFADQGGGIYNTYLAIVSNATLFGNTAAADGGAMYSLGNAGLFNTTVFDNNGATAGGVYSQFMALFLFNSILAYNQGQDCINAQNVSPVGFLGGSNNLIRVTDTCDTIPNRVLGEPNFGELTQAPNGTLYFPLRGRSAALDAGTSEVLFADTLSADQTDGNRAVGSGIDLGSHEATFALLDVNDDGVISPSDAVYVTNRVNTPAANDPFADVNRDGRIDVTDVNLVTQFLGQSVTD